MRSPKVASNTSPVRYLHLPTHLSLGWRNWQTQRTQNWLTSQLDFHKQLKMHYLL
jgi:hypothetical protein